jgi:multiple sugar transport system permease protein
MSSVAVAPPRERTKKLTRGRVLLHAFLVFVSLLWLAPVAWTLYTSFRPYEETAEKGYVSIASEISFDNYTAAWDQAEFPKHFINTMIVAIPAVIVTIFLAACVAFVVSRLSLRFNLILLIVFLSANLLPQQVILTPLYRVYLRVPLPEWLSDSELLFDSYLGIILIHIGFQVGFCTFVLSNYMKTLPPALGEAARVDGAGVGRQFFQITLPLCTPALAALATLQFTWIYNDFLWALVLMQSGDKRPITSTLANLQGQFFTDNNLVAAASLLIALPTIFVFAVLQRQFVSGLTLGANKG